MTEERLLHIIYRHPELRGKENMILKAVKDPKELYEDRRGCFHSIFESEVVSDYLVVIYCDEEEGIGIIRTSYFISRRRKERRYRWFKRLI